MIIGVSDLANNLKIQTAWQRTPMDLADEDYALMIYEAIKTLYIDTGRTQSYPGVLEEYEFEIDEERYIMLCAQINFFKRVQMDVNNIVSYTTDALSIASADKPYAHLQDTISELDRERRRVYYKMSRFTYED